MSQVVVPNSAQVTLFWAFGGGGTLGYTQLGAVKGAATINQALANNLDTAIKSAFSAASALGSHVHTSASLLAVGVRDTSSALQAMFVGSGGAAVGTGAGDALPPSTSLVISLKTDQAGPRHRGRVYLGGFTEADNSGNGVATSSLGTACQNFVNSISTVMSSNGLTLGVLSRPDVQKTITKTWTDSSGVQHEQIKVQKARPGEIRAVQSINLRNLIWDNQRRRAAPGKTSSFLVVSSIQAGEDNLPFE